MKLQHNRLNCLNYSSAEEERERRRAEEKKAAKKASRGASGRARCRRCNPGVFPPPRSSATTHPSMHRASDGGLRKVFFPDASDLWSWQLRSGMLNIAFVFLRV